MHPREAEAAKRSASIGITCRPRVLPSSDPGSKAVQAKGFGETPITGVPAAIGNAIFNATGRRLREVPVHHGRAAVSTP